MSHVINHTVYDESVCKKNVQAEWDDTAARDDYQEGCRSLAQSIRWIDHICESYDDAMKFIEENDSGWYDQLAVKFKKEKETAGLTKAKERCKRLSMEYETMLADTTSLTSVKAQLLTCRHCNSKIAVSYIKNYRCPVCGEDLRSPTYKDRLAAKKIAVKKAETLLKEETKKASAHGEVFWLVKTEYHV